MFTGIITATGKIISAKPLGSSIDDGIRLKVDSGTLLLTDVALGDSLCINGACMTVVSKNSRFFEVNVSRESLNRTVGLDISNEVNLEKSLTLADRLGGHLISGHIDGYGVIERLERVGESWKLIVKVSLGIAKYLVYKGSITLNGVSLTVNRVDDTVSGCSFWVNIIPHTFEVTTLRNLEVGQKVNLEVDLVARYVERMLRLNQSLIDKVM